MAIENLLAYVQSIQVCSECTSGQWDVQDAPDAGYKIIRSVWHPWQVINVEGLTGYAEYSDVNTAFQSPQWSFELAPDPVTPSPGPNSNLPHGRPIVDNGHTHEFVATNSNDLRPTTIGEGQGQPKTLTSHQGYEQTNHCRR